jgi:putative phosphoribosyl transferase
MARFRDRRDAGELIANHLAHQGQKFDLVVALPRGGVEVALPISMRLKIPLDILIVKKLGAIKQPELALGAIASGGYIYINYDLCRDLKVSQREIAHTRLEASRALLAREERLLHGRERPNWTGKKVLIVDDGIATGATMEVAIRAVKARQPDSLAVAVPVASISAIERLHRRIDHVFALQSPTNLGSVSEFYRTFPEVSDEEVANMLDDANKIERKTHDFATRS